MPAPALSLPTAFPAEPVPLSELPGYLRAYAECVRPFATGAAEAFELSAQLLEESRRAAADDVLTLAAAADESGFSYDHLQKQVRSGEIPNAGTERHPRIRRADLPPSKSAKRMQVVDSSGGASASFDTIKRQVAGSRTRRKS